MKRKFFSKLLMGVIAIATISIVACKDYDDEINDLQEQINKKAFTDNVEALQTKLATLAANSENALKTAQEALAKADNAATKDALEAVMAAATKAGEDAASAIQKANDAAAAASDAATAAENAQSTASQAQEAAIAAKEAADKAVAEAAKAAADAAGVGSLKEQVESQLKTIGELQSQLTIANGLSEKVKELEQKVAAFEGTGEKLITYVDIDGTTKTGTVEEALAAATRRVAAYEQSIDAIWSAVTSVSLYVSGGIQTHGNIGVFFLNTIVKENANLKPDSTYCFPLNEKVTDKQVTFKAGVKVTYVDTLTIRVSPTNAQLTSDMISLINSQGVEISKDFIGVEVFPYEKILTRAASSNGLWKVALKLKDGYKKEDFNAISEFEGKDVLYAIAVNNTAATEVGKDRRVISEYDVYLNEGNILHAWNFYVNNDNVTRIHNRWSRAEDGTQTYWPTNDKKNIKEMVWLNGIDKAVTEDAVSEENSNDRYDSYNATVDNRQGRNCIVAEQGLPIHIDFRNLYATDEYFGNKPIRAFYVTLDQDFAVESAPSEINAWRSYSYKNVGFTKHNGDIVPAHLFEGNTGDITIEDMNGVRGDIIGFRVYAVNYDGTVFDPDGRAFYVLVGKVVEDIELPEALEVTVHANAGDSAIIDVPAETFTAEANQWTRPEWTKDNPYVAISGAFYKPVAETIQRFAHRGTGTEYTYGAYATDNMFVLSFSEDGFNWQPTPDENTVKVKVVLNQAQSMLDDEIYSIKFKGQRATANATENLQAVTVKIKKVLPNDVPELIVKAAQSGNIKPLKTYMKPVIGWPSASWVSVVNIWNLNNKNNVVYGQDIKPFDFADIFTNLQTPLYSYVDKMNYKFEIEESDLKAEDEYVSTFAKYGMWDLAKNRNNISATVANTYTVPYAHADKIEDNKAKKVTVHYVYPNLSLVEENQNPVWYNVERKQDYSDKFQVQYLCALRMENIRATAENEWPAVMTYTAKQDAAATVKATADKALSDAKTDSTNAQKAFDKAKKDYGDAKKKLDADPTNTDLLAKYNQAYSDSTTAEATLTNAINAKHTAEANAKTAADNKTAADADLAAAKKAFNSIFVVAYEEDWHAVPMDALYFLQKDMPYLGLTAATYATRSELPLNAYFNNLLAQNYLNIDPNSIYLYLKGDNTKAPNEDYFKPVLSYTQSDPLDATSATIPAIILRKTRSTEEPALTDDVKFMLCFTVEDVFGHKHVREFEIKMNKPVLQSRKF